MNKGPMSFELGEEIASYPCNYCQRVYTKESDRTKHEKRHHKSD